MFKQPRSALMIKIGGSVLDAEVESGHAVIGQLVAPLKELQQNFDVFITPGGGPAWDVRKLWRKRYGTSAEDFKEFAKLNLKLNAMELAIAFGKHARLCPPQEFQPELFIAQKNVEYVRICYWPPFSLINEPEQAIQSDLQTLLLAEALAQTYDEVNVVFIKRTEGIYYYDPRLNNSKIENILSNALISANNRQQYLKLEQTMKRYEVAGDTANQANLMIVKTSELLSGKISRLGEDGDDDHLMERSAIEFLHDASHKISQVGIIHYAQTQYILEMINTPQKNAPYSLIRRG